MQTYSMTKWVVPAALVLAGCGASPEAPSGGLRTGSAVDEGACLTAVAAETGTVTSVISSDLSQANTLVIIGVERDQTRWRCLVSGGTVTEIMSLSSEVAL